MSSQHDKHPASETLTLRLERCYTGVVHDVMRGMGLRNFTLPPELRPLMPETAMALSAETLKNKGVRGCVVDGFVRDSNFLLAIGFQTWGRGFTPRDVVGHWLPDATQVEIRIGDVDIAPGDYLVGDRDGMIRVPAHLLEQVIDESERAMTTESLVRKAILSGTDPQQAYLKFGKF